MDKLEIGTIYKVDWLDAIAHAHWHTPDASIVDCVSVGYLVDITDDAIELASTVSDVECNASMVLPRGMIKSIKKLK